MNPSAAFIRRPVATGLAAVSLALAGLLAFWRLPVAPLPRVDLPTLSVSASLPGASPEVMAASIASPLERALGRIGGVTEMTSTSATGSAQITLQFDLRRDIEGAARDVQAAINAAGADLPANLPSRPSIRKVNPADAPILILSLTSQSLSLAQIYDVANRELAEGLSQVEGVGQVFLGGGGQPAIRVQADPRALAARGLTLEDVRRTMVGANLKAPQGALGDRRRQTVLRAETQLEVAADWARLPLAGDGDQLTLLGDVATVVHDAENLRAAAWSDGRRAVLMIIRRAPDANIIAVIARIRALLPQLGAQISPEIDIQVALDRSRTIASSIAEVGKTLAVTGVLVGLVVWAFLGRLRATAVPAAALPLSLLGTCATMALFGFSLNNFSLMALTIATGFVVDDAIVVTENIERHIEAGRTPRRASLAGTAEIGFTVVSITVSLLAVFLPLLAMSGIVGRLFREFAVTLGAAIVLSAVISLTLTPMMASQLLSARPAAATAPTALQRVYGRGLAWSIAHPAAVLALTACLTAGAWALFAAAPKGLFPQQDTGTLIGLSQAGQDASFAAMQERQSRINAIVSADPDVAHMVSFIGQSSGAGNTGTMFVELAPRPGRRRSAEEVIGDLRPRLAGVAGISLFLQSVQDVRVGGRSRGSQYQYTLQSWRLGPLREAAPRMLAALARQPLLRDVNSDLQAEGPAVTFALDRDRLAALGVGAGDVDQVLYDAFGQRMVSIIYRANQSYRVVLEARLPEAPSPQSLAALWVPSAGGAPVPLSALGRASLGRAPLSIDRQGQAPAVTLSFNLAPGASLGEAAAQVAAAEREVQLPASVRGALAGTAGLFKAAAGDQARLVALALICVFIVLGVLYESLVHPITILSTLPSAGVGAMLALRLSGTELSIIALVGVILLVGIVKKNAIMMVDFAIALERAGRPPEQAIVAAALARFRPITMTTLAALFGSLPLALGGGEGHELRRPLGITIVGGLVVSQLFTLFSTPVVYLAMGRLARRLSRLGGG